MGTMVRIWLHCWITVPYQHWHYIHNPPHFFFFFCFVTMHVCWIGSCSGDNHKEYEGSLFFCFSPVVYTSFFLWATLYKPVDSTLHKLPLTGFTQVPEPVRTHVWNISCSSTQCWRCLRSASLGTSLSCERHELEWALLPHSWYSQLGWLPMETIPEGEEANNC